MVKIIVPDVDPLHLQQLANLFLCEWDKIDPFDSALTAINNERVVGGLVFTEYPVPGTEDNGLWINALYLESEYRGKGIGTLLIKAAASEALRNKAKEIYVYTNVPELYLKAGWVLVEVQGEHKVLKNRLT